MYEDALPDDITDAMYDWWYANSYVDGVRIGPIIENKKEDGGMNLNNQVWKSFVWHEGKCFLVSTIERDFDTYEGTFRGKETITWEYDWESGKRGELVHQAGGILDHQDICRSLLATGEFPKEDDG